MHARINIEKGKYRVYSRFNGKTLMYLYVNEEDAKEKCYELNYSYYSENKKELPRGIRINKTNKNFTFQIRVDYLKNKHICTTKDLDKLIEMRKHIIKNLLSLF